MQTVTADDPADASQVRLIREHLTEEAARFGRGDFGDPASIHGERMPGLRELSAATGGSRSPTRSSPTAPDSPTPPPTPPW
nr:hypothetical protein GCM10020093_009760 [Planobispora longispora]